MFAQVFVGGVAEHGDDDAFFDLLGYFQGRGDVGSRGDANEQALFFGKALYDFVCVLGFDTDVFVSEIFIINARHDGGRHVLEAFESVEAGCRLHGDELYVGRILAQAATDAHEGAGGAESGDEVSDAAAGLVPDLDAGSFVMGQPVGRIVVLIRVEVLLRVLPVLFAAGANGAVGALGGFG